MAEKKPFVNYSGTIKELSAGDYLDLFGLKLRNAANTFVNTFANATTAARTWTLPNKDVTFAGYTDIKSVCDFRLTLTSNTPVTTSDVTGATTIYCTPYKGNSIALYDGANWNVIQSAQVSVALGTLINAIGYDVFCYDNSGTPTLELLAWTNSTTRATALTYQDGVLVKSGAATRRYLGSFYTTSTTTTEDSEAKRYLFNYYHRVEKSLKRFEDTANWTQINSGAFRQANSSSSNQVSVFKGVDEDIVQCNLSILSATNSLATTAPVNVAIGLDSTTTKASNSTTDQEYCTSTFVASPAAYFKGFVGLGKHDLVWLESGYASSTITWYSNPSSNSSSGLLGSTRC